MKITRAIPPHAVSNQTFTGEVKMAPMVEPEDPAHIKLTVVHFENGARTNWHIHPGEQVLYVLDGHGRVGNETEETTLQPGDVVHAPAGEKHWHGAMPGHSMTHLSITTGAPARWFDPPPEN